MSTTQTLLLGAVAGFTIYLGLPMARVRGLPKQVGSALNAIATGILIFLFWDVLSHGVEPVETHLQAHSWGAFAGYASLLVLGVAAGMMCLVYYDGWLKDKRATPLLGTLVGQAWVSPALATAFFAVAAGSILYVVIQLLEVCRRAALPRLIGWMLLLGLLLGFATDWILVAAGA